MVIVNPFSKQRFEVVHNLPRDIDRKLDVHITCVICKEVTFLEGEEL